MLIMSRHASVFTKESSNKFLSEMPLVFAATNFSLVWISYSQSDDYTSAFLFPVTRTKGNSREMFKNMAVHTCYMLSSLDITIRLLIVIYAF